MPPSIGSYYIRDIGVPAGSYPDEELPDYFPDQQIDPCNIVFYSETVAKGTPTT